jgi:hypothetical protein
MALAASFKDPLSKLTHSNAYARIVVVNLRYDYSPLTAVVHLGFWSNKTAAKKAGTQELTHSYSIPLTDLNEHWLESDKHDPRGAVYRWLKHHVPAEGEPDLRKARKV